MLFRSLKKDETIKESRILSFGSYVGIFEEFDVQSALKTASEQNTAQKTKTGGSKSSSSTSSKSLIFKEGSKGPEVTAIQNVVEAPVQGTDEQKNQMFGPITKQAVMDWQKKNGFTGKDADGIVGPKSIKKMAEVKNLGTWTASMISKLSGSKGDRKSTRLNSSH